jgi:hypothetical protein
MMGDDKSARSLSPMGGRDRDLELLIPVSGGSGSGGSPTGDDDVDRTASSSASAALSSSGREVRPSRLPVIVTLGFSLISSYSSGSVVRLI